jgi:hypothetical protein
MGSSLGVGSSDFGGAGSINVSVGVAGTTTGGLQLWSTTTGQHYVQFGDGTAGAATYAGAIGYSHATDQMFFYANWLRTNAPDLHRSGYWHEFA